MYATKPSIAPHWAFPMAYPAQNEPQSNRLTPGFEMRTFRTRHRSSEAIKGLNMNLRVESRHSSPNVSSLANQVQEPQPAASAFSPRCSGVDTTYLRITTGLTPIAA